MIRFFILLCGMLNFSLVFAEDVRIAGKVRDNDNNPLEGVTVRIPDTSFGVYTNSKGEYTLTVSANDTIRIAFSCVGFKTVTHKLIDAKGDVTVNVKLYPNDRSLTDVVVSGKNDNMNGMRSLNTDGLRFSPDVSGGSVEALLTTLPGVHSSNELSSQYSVRGGSFDENSVYINGIEVYRPQFIRSGEQEGLSVINPDMAGDIRFSSGGFPARYDDRMSSALDITYRRPRRLEAGVTLSLTGGSLSFGSGGDKFSMLHGLRLKRNNSLLSSLDTKGEYDPLHFDYQTNLSYKLSSSWSVNFLGNVNISSYKFQPEDRETSFGTVDNINKFRVYFDGLEKDLFETYFGTLTLNYKKSRNTAYSISLSAFLANESVAYDISGEYWLNRAGTGTGDELSSEIGVGKYMEHERDRLKTSVITAAFRGKNVAGVNHITYGVSFDHRQFRDSQKGWEWRDSAGYSLPTAPGGVNLIYNLTSQQNLTALKLAAFVEDALYFDTKSAFMALNIGARISYLDFNDELLFSPRINFSLTPAGNVNLTFRGATGIYYQSPFYKEYREVIEDDSGNCKVALNNNIKSPRSIHFLVGSDYVFNAFDRPFKLTGELYYKSMADLISYEYDNLRLTYSGRNDAKGYAAGFDMRLFGQFVPGTDSWFSFSLMKTEQTLNGVKTPLPSDRRFSFGLFFNDYFPKFPRLRFSLRGIYSDGLTVTPPRVTRDVAYFRSPAYKRVDIGFNYIIAGLPEEGFSRSKILRGFRSLSIGADVFNLFDITNVSSYYWVTGVNNVQYAVPNYLTRRQINIKLTAEF